MKIEEQIAIEIFEYAEENSKVQPIDYVTFVKNKNKIEALALFEFIYSNAKLFHSSYFNKLLLYLISSFDQKAFNDLNNWHSILETNDKEAIKKTIEFLTKYLNIDAIELLYKNVLISKSIKIEIISEFLDFLSPLLLHSIDKEELDETDQECHVKQNLNALRDQFILQGIDQFNIETCIDKWAALKLRLAG